MKKLIIASALVLVTTGLYASYPPEEPCQMPEFKSFVSSEAPKNSDELLMQKLDALIELEAKQVLLLEDSKERQSK